jgi:hypothetical protein
MNKLTVGEPLPYGKLNRKGVRDIRSLRGIFKSWDKAPKFVLRLDSNGLRYYLSSDEQLTRERKEAKIFRKGFDSEEVKEKYWNNKLGLKFHAEDY